MKICHFCLNGPYNDGWNYQENILPKYHAKLGYDVYQIVTTYIWKGTEQVEVKPDKYLNADGVKIIRLKPKKGLIGGHRFDRYPNSLFALEEIKPDILFIHDVQTLEMKTVVKYLKNHSECIVYADNHSDFSNSARNWVSKNIIHKLIWKHMAQIVNPYVSTFYGVLPARVDFLTDVYKLPKEKCELLVMGADDELVEKTKNSNSRERIREKHNVSKNDFLIVTGGKIDLFKTQTILLMEAIHRINRQSVKLIVFGSLAPELKERVERLSDGECVNYIGWINANDSYDYFGAADLVVFPGRHSVFWEQVAGMGIPMIVKHWDGTTHVDVCDNVKFLYDDSVEEIQTAVEAILIPEEYIKMKHAAEKASQQFKYSDIARRSIKIKEAK